MSAFTTKQPKSQPDFDPESLAMVQFSRTPNRPT